MAKGEGFEEEIPSFFQSSDHEDDDYIDPFEDDEVEEGGRTGDSLAEASWKNFQKGREDAAERIRESEESLENLYPEQGENQEISSPMRRGEDSEVANNPKKSQVAKRRGEGGEKGSGGNYNSENSAKQGKPTSQTGAQSKTNQMITQGDAGGKAARTGAQTGSTQTAGAGVKQAGKTADKGAAKGVPGVEYLEYGKDAKDLAKGLKEGDNAKAGEAVTRAGIAGATDFFTGGKGGKFARMAMDTKAGGYVVEKVGKVAGGGIAVAKYAIIVPIIFTLVILLLIIQLVAAVASAFGGTSGVIAAGGGAVAAYNASCQSGSSDNSNGGAEGINVSDPGQRAAAEYIWDELVKNGFTKEGAAGVLGNMITESALNPQALGGPEVGGPFWGLVQWNIARWEKAKVWMKENGYNDPFTIKAQVAYVIAESRMIPANNPARSSNPAWNGKTIFDVMNTWKTPEEAADYFDNNYEISARTSVEKRKSSARGVYNQFKDRTIGQGATNGPVTAFINTPRILLSSGMLTSLSSIPAGLNQSPMPSAGFMVKTSNDAAACSGSNGGGVSPDECPTEAPPGTVQSNKSIKDICVEAISNAGSGEAARAIIWALSNLNEVYVKNDPVKRMQPGWSDCSSFVAKAYDASGAVVNGKPFSQVFGGTVSYMPSSYTGTNLTRLPDKGSLKPGDIVIQFNGDNPALSDGDAGHALIYLGNDMVVQQSGMGVGGKANIAPYKNSHGNAWFFHYKGASLTVGKNDFSFPMRNYQKTIGRHFQEGYHFGIDISWGANEPILAVAPGKVVNVVSGCGIGDFSCGGGYGNFVEIEHGNGYTSIYAHMKSVNVKNGQTVGRSAVIGIQGNTGHSFGDHLHFEIKKGGKKIDPMSVMHLPFKVLNGQEVSA